MFAGKESRWSLAEPNHKMESCKDLELGQEDSEASSRTEGYYTPPEEEREKASLGESEEADEATPRQPFPLSNVSVSQLDSTFSSESPIGTLEATSKLGSRNLEGCLENFDLSNDLEQLKQLGNHFFTQGDYSAAINCYNAILESTPKKLSVLANRAMCYLKLDNIDKAIQDSETCIETNPVWPKGYYIKGMALLHKGNADMAASCFGHGLEFCPSDRKLIEGKRKAIHLQVGGNNPEPLESTKGSAFPLSRSVTTNNEESQNFNFTGLTDWKEIDPQTAGSAAEPNEGSLNGISDRAENNEAQRNSPNDKGKMNNNFGNKESLVSVETEVSRILHAPNFYSVLRVPVQCTREEVEQNYKMLSHILNSHEPKVENVEAANQVVETAHDILSSTIKRRLYEQFLQGKNKRKRNNRDSSSIQNHLEMTGNGQSVRWQTDDTEVRLPKFVEYILRLRNFGWLLLLLLFVLFLPVIIALVLLGMILWFILSPIVRIIRTWYPSVRETHAASETQSSPFSFFRHRRIRSGNFLCLPIGS